MHAAHRCVSITFCKYKYLQMYELLTDQAAAQLYHVRVEGRIIGLISNKATSTWPASTICPIDDGDDASYLQKAGTCVELRVELSGSNVPGICCYLRGNSTHEHLCHVIVPWHCRWGPTQRPKRPHCRLLGRSVSTEGVKCSRLAWHSFFTEAHIAATMKMPKMQRPKEESCLLMQ